MAGNSNFITIEERLRQLEEAKEIARSEGPKIQRVARYLRDREHLAEHYSPKLVSFGPIHHGAPNLQLGERYKQMWVARYIHVTGQDPQTLHDRILADIEKLKELFDADLFTSNDLFSKYSDQGFRNMDEKISWSLFVDGCALLYILQNANQDLLLNFHLTSNQEKVMGLKIEDLIHVIRDVFLLENQLPYQLLELLWIDTNGYTLIRTMESFLRDCVSSSTIDEDLTFSDPPTHLLDLQRSIFLYQDNLRHVPVDVDTNQTQNYRKGNMAVRYRNITELKVANIILKKGKTCHPRDLSFSHYKHYLELMLPEIVVNDTTVDPMFNLTAYERCHDFENDYGICSYYSFLNSLIDHHDDVKELKLRGILLNSLRNDEEVANFFNTIGTTLVPEKGKYAHVRAQIERQYNNKSLATWLVRMRDTFFNKPFDFFMFYLAIVGTWLTAIQTWYAIREAN